MTYNLFNAFSRLYPTRIESGIVFYSAYVFV